MFRSKKIIFVIAFSMLALFGMQAMWLYYAIRQERHFLNAGTRQAALESLTEVEQKEDTKVISASLDTIIRLHSDDPKKMKKTAVKIIIGNNQKKVIINDSGNGTMSSSYAYSTDRGLNSQVHITATENFETISDNPKEKGKLKDYEKILKKMIYQTGTGDLKIEDRVRFPELYRSILKNLRDRGIDILPAVAVKDKDDKIIFKTENYYDAPGIVLAMFSHDIVFQNYSLHVFYPSSINYIFKQAIGVIVMSVLVTILLVLVILMLYRKMLTEQKLNQYKNDFINNLTHELKTPLATISLANSNIASAAGFSNQENLKQYTQIIEEENKKLNNHIEKVFELSLLEKERQMFEKRDLDLHEIIRESLAQNDALVKSSGAEIILSLNAATHIIRGDKFHLTNVISNLLDNAIKYNGGKAKVTIATTNERNRLVLTIKDNGIGISSEHQKLIFDKFFRVTDKDIHTTKGFGVGLSYVKQIVEHLGGVISVNSELNKGSEFTIILPYAEN